MATAASALFLLPGMASALPDGYVYEMVSPPYKASGEVDGGGGPRDFRVAEDGNAVLYTANGLFAGNYAGPGLLFMYSAHRGETGWETTGLRKKLAYNFLPDALFTNNNPEMITPAGISDDGKRVLLGSNFDLETEEFFPNTYFRVETASGDFERVTPPPVAGSEHVRDTPYITGDPSFDTIYFSTPAQLTDESTQLPAASKLYRYRDGEVELASHSPSGDPAPGVPVDAAGNPADPVGPNSASVDGDVYWFYDSASNRRLYRGEVGEAVRFVNASENTGTTVPAGQAWFRGANEDGSKAVFSSSQRLVDEVDQAGTGSNLYLYSQTPDGSGRHLTLISEDSEPADGTDVDVTKVLGVSDDVSTVYFATTQQLVDGETTAAGEKVYRWHNGDLEFLFLGTVTMMQPGTTADGRFFAFKSSAAGITPDDNGGLEQLYLHDADAADPNPVVCVSCRAGGPSTSAIHEPFIEYARTGKKPRRWLADNGRAFFMTEERLLPEDVNGDMDVYTWHDGELDLITTGRSEHPVRFADASADGSTVMFTTYDRLSGWDQDYNADLYAARLNGGLPEPAGRPVEPCSGDDCQPEAALPPALGAMGSRSVVAGEDGKASPAPNCRARQAGVRRASRRFKSTRGQVQRLRRNAARATGARRAIARRQVRKVARQNRQARRQLQRAQRQLRACREANR